MSDALLQVRGLHAQYGPTRVLHGIDFDVRQGGITTILGANGAGKTTTLRAVCGMVRTQGQVLLAGESIEGKATEAIVRLGVAHVPDGRGTFLNLTVEENLRLGAYTRKDREQVLADFERMYGYFPRLRERLRQQAGTLSGGEQQMLAIARALMGRPRLLLLDEPSMGLAPLMVEKIFEVIRSVAAQGVTILLVEQNARLALQTCTRGYVMESGLITLADSAANLLADSRVRAAYLGE